MEIKLLGPGGDVEGRPLVWHVAAASEEGVDLDTFTVGLEPEGFETLVALDDPLDPDVEYDGWTNVVGAGPNIGRLDEESRNFSFQPSELTSDWVETYTGDPVEDAESFDPPC